MDTELDIIIAILARAGVRYMITVAEKRTSVIIEGTRATVRPRPDDGQVELLFTPEGFLINAKGRS